MGRRISGSFCEKVVAPKGVFDRRSFRWKKSGRAWVMTGCRRGHWKRERCTIGLTAHVVLVKTNDLCRVGERKIRKG